MKHHHKPRAFCLRLWQAVSRVTVSTVVLSVCSCSSLNRPVAATGEDPFLESASRPHMVAKQPDRDGSEGRPVLAQAAQPQWSRGSAVRQASYENQSAGSPEADAAVQQMRAEARMTLSCPPCPEGCAEEGGYYPDEYLCDGGDRELPVHYEQDRMRGLETEDTVVEYIDEDGRRRVKPSRKVCIYAPRFASVVSVSAPIEDVGGGRPIETVMRLQGAGMNSRQATIAQEQREGTERLLSRSRSSGLITGVASDALDLPIGMHTNEHTTVVLEDYAFLRTGQLIKSEGAWLERRVQAAAIWTRDQNPVIAAQDQAAQELRSPFNVAELVGQENRYQGKSRLRIVKLADRDVAQPGDIVTFTIRFDNIGDQPVRDVVIVDNLTPRLEYVEDSGTLDRGGRLVTDDNAEGSLILRWELEEPLAGRTGGVATFQARVR